MACKGVAASLSIQNCIIFNQVVFATMVLLIADIFNHRKNTSSQFTTVRNPCIPTQVVLANAIPGRFPLAHSSSYICRWRKELVEQVV